MIFFALMPVFATKAQINPQGPAAECAIQMTNSNWTGTNNTEVKVSHNKVSTRQPFSASVKINLSPNETAQCKANGAENYEVAVFAYNRGLIPVGCKIGNVYNYQRSFKLTFDENGKNFNTQIDKITFDSLFQGTTYGTGNDFCFYFYLHKKTDKSTFFGYAAYEGPINGLINLDQGTTIYPASDPNMPNINRQDFEKSTTIDQSKSIPASSLKVQFTNGANGGLRDKYRLVKTDGDMSFGVTKGLEGIYVKWPDAGPKLALNQYLALTDRADYSVPQKDPKYQYTKIYFADGAAKFSTNGVCQASILTEGCTGVYSTEWGNTNGNKGEGAKVASAELSEYAKPVLKADGWNKSKYASMKATDGKPLGTEKVFVVPVVWAQSALPVPIGNIEIPAGFSAYLIGKSPPSTIIEIYETEADLIKACQAEHENDKSFCTPDNARYQIGKAVEATVSSSEKDSNNSPSQTLYGFIVRVISSIIVWLQSIIYRIFAYVVVPILKALLSVRPYEDAFVNIIYPGWLILRNIANIFFIVALLVVGLRILFQQSASSTARGFIVRLIIMALLVNFSLVIAQGVVGIADTVQAQFLPKDSRVIEALGAKLMVEPLKNFRQEVNNSVDGGGFTENQSELSLADTIKPLILLFLSLASFASFVAVAGFLLVRLVALWVLYMTSPIAYVGYVMDETKGYASKWWKEFIKYVMITPVLAFFLNIAALMATVFAGSDNSLFTKYNPEESLSGDIVIGSLTIITHFIVLGFIFAGMKYAQSSGVYGAEKIVGFAQKLATTVPNAIKDFVVDKTASGLERAQGTRLGAALGAGALARGLTAAAKPVEFSKALKKAWLDEPLAARQKREAERLGNTFLTRSSEDTSKLGSSLKKAKEKMKDFEGDDAPYLSGEFGSGYGKKDQALTAAALLKMGQEGQFKEMLEKAEELTGNKYSRDAAGLSAMTEDLANNGRLTENNRRDLLNEFDKSAQKKKKNAHYGGNLTYNAEKKKYETRHRQAAPNNNEEEPDRFAEDGYKDEKSWVRGQIKGRIGEDNKGSLLSDLYQTHEDAALDKATGHFSMVQVGVFAEQNPNVLRDEKLWKQFEQKNTSKFNAMQEAIEKPEKREALRANMVRYFSEVHPEKDAEAEANTRINLIAQGLNFRQGGVGDAVRRGDRDVDQIGFVRQRRQDDDEDDDTDDDDEPTARTRTSPGPTRTASTTTMSTPSTGSGIGSTAAQQLEGQSRAPIIGDDVFGNGVNPDVQRGSTYPLDTSNKNKPQPNSKPKNKIGFIRKEPDDKGDDQNNNAGQ